MPIRNEIKEKQQIRKGFLMRLTEYAGHYRKVTENFLEATKRIVPCKHVHCYNNTDKIMKILQWGRRNMEIKRIKYVGFKKNESDGGKTDIEFWH